MSEPITTRHTRSRKTGRTHAAAQKPSHPNIFTGFVQAPRLISPRTTTVDPHRLPPGFLTAVNHAFMRQCRIWDRARNVRLALETFDQPENVLPTEIREFLQRFEDLD